MGYQLDFIYDLYMYRTLSTNIIDFRDVIISLVIILVPIELKPGMLSDHNSKFMRL